MSTSYACEGTLLVPSDSDRSSRWKEHLMSGNRMKVVLETVNNQRSEEGFLLWGENYRQEKLFEINLKTVKSYFIRKKTWHELTASHNRKFVLTFEEDENFSIFYEHLENALKSLKKFTTDKNLEMERDSNSKIVVLRVDRIPPKKPPRCQTNTSVDEDSTFDMCDEFSQSSSKNGNVQQFTDCPVKLDNWETNCNKAAATVWYTDVCDFLSENSDSAGMNIENEHIYDTIGTAMDETSNHSGNTSAAPKKGGLRNEHAYDNVTYVHYSKPNKARTNPAVRSTGTDDTGLKEVCLDDSLAEVNTDKQLSIAKRRFVTKNPLPADTTSRTYSIDQADSLNGEAVMPRPMPKPRFKQGSPSAARSSEECWTCELCTLVNAITDKACAVCGIRRNLKEDETANALRRLASSYVVSSDVFHSLTSVPPPAAVAEDGGWQCSRCSTQNCLGHKLCRSCSAWVCDQCTLHNQPDHLMCLTCTSPKCGSFTQFG